MFLDDIVDILVAAGVGTVGSGGNIFLTSAAVIPSGAGPYLTISETGGSSPRRIQNTPRGNLLFTGQLLARATKYTDARGMSQAAFNALDGLYNTVTPTTGVKYVEIAARQEPTDMGLDEQGRPRLVFNIDAEQAFPLS